MDAVVIFFAATYTFTWGAWIAADHLDAAAPRALLILLGTFAPGIVALCLTAVTRGKAATGLLVRRLFIWRVPARWYLFAVSYVAIVKLTVAVAYRVVSGVWPAFGAEPLYLMLAATLASTFVGGQIGEELGWRGYALPALTIRFGLGAASVLLGLLWACWHLPLFFLLAADTVGQSFPLYVLQVTALSIAVSWLYAHSRGSLLPVMLLHAAVNNTKDIVPSAEAHATDSWALSHSPVAWMTVTALWICAIYFLVDFRRSPRLTRNVARPAAP